MAEIQFDYKKFLSNVNLNLVTFIVAFLVTVFIFSLYTYYLNNKGKERLGEMYELKSQHDEYEILNSDFYRQLENAHQHSLSYFYNGKELNRFQAIESISQANNAFNELFSLVQKIDMEKLPTLVEAKGKLFEFESGLLTKLAYKDQLPDAELVPIMTDVDTLSHDFEAFQSVDTIEKISLDEESELLQSVENDLFELDALISGEIAALAAQKANRSIFEKGVFILIIGLILLTFFFMYYQIQGQNLRQIKLSSEHLRKIATGELPDKLKPGKNQFNELVENSNQIIDYMHDASEFATNIGEGNFGYKFKPKSDEDKLGNALIDMQSRLQQVASEDKIRNWINEGQAKFGEILRNAGNDVEKMGDEVISNLINYLDASMGVIYVKNEDHKETRLELLSAFAYNRKKHEERILKVGEGLAGQVFQEKKRVLLKEVKTDHYNIVTGMGESRPSSVLIVPLKQEENIEGVLEMASFNVFEEYQINFVEKIGESIATAIKSGKTNKVTTELLQEMQTREEEMRTQEEELKQNMEELSATQEQMERLRKEDEERKMELESKRKTLYEILDSLDSSIYLKNSQGQYRYVNKKYAQLLSLDIDRIIGRKDEDLLEDGIVTKRKQREEEALSGISNVVHSEEINNKKFTLSLISIQIPDLAEKGVLGVLRE